MALKFFQSIYSTSQKVPHVLWGTKIVVPRHYLPTVKKKKKEKQALMKCVAQSSSAASDFAQLEDELVELKKTKTK